MKYYLIGLYYFFKASLLSCHIDKEQGFERGRRYYNIKHIADLDAHIDESSGLALTADSTLLSHNDSGGAPMIYEINLDGILLDSVRLPLKNIDWEDIDIDSSTGTIYIADTGNNRNKRKDLRCYAYHPNGMLDTLAFSYSDQRDFPPQPDSLHYDCEGIVYDNQQIHLFSKNRGADRNVRHYQYPVSVQETAPSLIYTEDILLHEQQVTGAALSPDKKLLALITYGRIYLFRLDGSAQWFKDPWLVIKCNRMAQSEGITFLNNEVMVFSNEQGKLFRVSLNKRGKRRLQQP